MKTKICTTVEQSQKLIELGIDVNTADMRYSPLNLDIPWVWVGKPLIEKDAIPAWSLSALMMLMPYPSLHNTISGWRCDSYNAEGTRCKSGIGANSPLDAVYEMVCWLKENGYIKADTM